MSQTQQAERAAAKTRRAQLLHSLQTEFDLVPRIAQAVLEEAEACLTYAASNRQAGQREVVLVSRSAAHGQSLSETATKPVLWTVDDGESDTEMLLSQGRQSLRRVRIQRLLDEAVAQGALASQEDLAHALEVSVRTIKRDCTALQQAGVWLPLRGNVLSIGRGQTHKGQKLTGKALPTKGYFFDQGMRPTHKAQLVALYEQGVDEVEIARLSHHDRSSVGRYIRDYERVKELIKSQIALAQIPRLLDMQPAVVQAYVELLRLYRPFLFSFATMEDSLR